MFDFLWSLFEFNRRKQNLAAFDFEEGSLLLTEAGSKKRASLHVVRGEEGVEAINPGASALWQAVSGMRGGGPAHKIRG